VEPLQRCFELAFEGLQPRNAHKSGIAVRFPRIFPLARDKPAAKPMPGRRPALMDSEREGSGSAR